MRAWPTCSPCRRRAANGKLTQTTGSEVYRFSNAGDCAGGVVGLALAGLLDNAVEVFDTQFHLAQDDGNWAGGCFGDFVAFSGLKAWVAMVFYQLNHDKNFLADLYPYMLNDARWHAKRREQQRRTGPDGRPIRGYGLIQPTMHDCGMNDATGTGVFIPHNTWAVYADKVALDVARAARERRRTSSSSKPSIRQDARTCWPRSTRARSRRNGYRWIPSSPNDPSGSFWGALNTGRSLRLAWPRRPARRGNDRQDGVVPERRGPDEIHRLAEGRPVDRGRARQPRHGLSRARRVRQVRRGNSTPPSTTPPCSIPGPRSITSVREPPRSPATGSISGPRARSSPPCELPWCSNAATRCASAWACRGEWLASGKAVRVAGAPTAFGRTSFELRYDREARAIEGSVAVARDL